MEPAAAVTLTAIATGCRLENNTSGLTAGGAINGGSSRVAVGDCTISDNSENGIFAFTGGQLISFGTNSFAHNENSGNGHGSFTSTTPRF